MVSGAVEATGAAVSVAGGKLTSLTTTAGTVALSGKAKIDNLALTDVKVTVGELKTGALIAVNADGVFTDNFVSVDAAAIAAQYFKAADATEEITVIDLALSCLPKA